MYAMRFFVVQPVLEKAGFALQMPEGNFSLLVIAVCCLVSAAYVINDYFDTKADRISGNRPVIVGKTISRRAAIILHSILNVVAVGIAYYLAREAHHAEIVFLFLIISLVLWFYSSRIKKRFIWGNIVVAILAGLIPLTVITFEIPLLSDVYSDVVLKTHVSFAYVFASANETVKKRAAKFIRHSFLDMDATMIMFVAQQLMQLEGKGH